MEDYGFIRVAAATPKVKVADVDFNLAETIALIEKAEEEGVSLIAFPETGITGYSCGDLFTQQILIASAEKAVGTLKEFTRGLHITVVAGVPVSFRGRLYDCAVVLKDGAIKGIIPKIHIPAYGECYETRWFASGADFMNRNNSASGLLHDDAKNCYREGMDGEILYCGSRVTISPNQLFSIGKATFAVEIGEDLRAPVTPSSYHALAGAEIIVNLSASSESLSMHESRKKLISTLSGRTLSAYVYACSGYGESSQDSVCSGASLIYENGVMLAENERFRMESSIIVADVDVDMLDSERRKRNDFCSVAPDGTLSAGYSRLYSNVKLGQGADTDFNASLRRKVEPHPFLPCDRPEEYGAMAEEIISMQVLGLVSRLEHVGCKTAVIGVSGGLDSTLALIVTALAFDRMGRSRKDILGVTMPGLGTTGRTRGNAMALMEALGISTREISIVPSVQLHFSDIGHDPGVHDATYENAQARERTQILMDLANKENGIVVGTGDLSELALGWATYNGDHMSMYSVNAGVPKTLVRFLVRWASTHIAGEGGNSAGKILLDIADTPISPELVPAGRDGEILQRTESIVGPYELHDFFIYNFLRWGYSPSKVLFLARKAFCGKGQWGCANTADGAKAGSGNDGVGVYSEEEVEKLLKTFYRRFFSQQFKRSCLPDGPKVLAVSLSPRGDWRMPSDASAALWLKG